LKLRSTVRPSAPLALLVLLAACPPSTGKRDGAKGPLEPEQRFGNDPELVADFANLKTCVYRNGRLDRSCVQLVELQRRVRVKSLSRDPQRRTKVVTTLANLLESRRELTRLAAADNLFLHHRDPKIVAALEQALTAEKVPVVVAAMLRQVCWRTGPSVRQRAIELLDPAGDERVRAEAATCLGRHGKRSKESVAALVTTLKTDRSSTVLGNACAALGALRAEEAVEPMAAKLEDPKVGWRCSAALAEVGTASAYRALVAGVAAALDRGRMPTQHLSALGSFSGKKFFERQRVVALLERVAGTRELSWVARVRAVQELGRLEGSAELGRLRKLYAGAEKSEADDHVARELGRLADKPRP
jgi:HEAT repeat protein